jgi:two-component system, OmpR family, sensor histidine kinase KdpD
MIQLLGIVFFALRHNTKVTLTFSVLAVALFDFLFVPPRLAFAWSDAKRIVTFVGMIVVAGVISSLNERTRRQERLARETARRTQALLELQIDLSSTSQIRQLVAITQHHLQRLLLTDVTVILSMDQAGLHLADADLSAAERDLAERAWQQRELAVEAGVARFNMWLPLVGVRETLGVIGIAHVGLTRAESEPGVLLTACATQLATAIERGQLAVAVQRAQVEAEAERTRNSLLSAVSHDLKTPLATIVAAGTTLLAHAPTLQSAESQELLTAMVSEAERLARLVQDLLSITRLESPTVQLRRSPEAIEEIIAAARARVANESDRNRIHVDLAANLPWVLVEPALIEQVLINLLENALHHGGPAARIDIRAQSTNHSVIVEVLDDGPGLPEADLDKVFEKFYRGARVERRDGGVGLGLTICRSIVTTHGGRIDIRNRSEGGMAVEFSLPVATGIRTRPQDLERVNP